MAAKRLVRRVVLERTSRPLLARFLETHAAAFFAAHAFSLAALAASPTRDRSLVHRVFDLIHDRTLDPALPPVFRGLLAMLDAIATPHGGAAILRADEKGLIPRATYGDEDLALIMLLDHPHLAIEARREADANEVQSFTEYEMATGGELAFRDEERAALEKVLGAKLEARGRTRHCQVYVRREDGVVSLEIVLALRPRTFDKVDAQSLEVDQSTDIHTERAFAEVNVETGRLAIHAARATKDLVCESLGEVLGASPTHFRPARAYDLSPFANPAQAVSTEGTSPRLSRVELHGIHLQTSNGTVIGFTRPRHDLLQDDEASECLDVALRAGKPVAVKVYLFIEGRRHGVGVELITKGGRDLVDFDRSDSEVVEIVRGYLRARGVLRESIDPLRTETAPRVAQMPLRLTP